MKYENIKNYGNEKFKRLTGVKKETFEKMLEVVKTASKKFGRPAKLSLADQLLMTLMYWREYRTQFHIAETYEVSEATVCRTIKKVEDALVNLGEFTLPVKKYRIAKRPLK
jgi:DNA-directed RNA polymerase specialized sigma subunit